MNELTATQAKVLDYIAGHIVSQQRPPTRKELAAHFGWASVNAAEGHVRALEHAGHIALDGARDGSQWCRYIRVIRWPASVLPVLKLAAG